MAPSIFPNPLSNDGVDKLNHKWMLLLMLLLAFVSFIIPLHPFFHNNNDDAGPQTTLSPTSAQTLRPVKIPTYSAVCWPPSHFTQSSVLYTTAYCTKRYNSAIRGEGGDSVYLVPFSDVVPRMGDDVSKVQPIQSEDISPDDDDTEKQYIEQDPRYSELNEFKERVQKLVSFQTPICLLLLAICLGLSQIVWAFLTECFGSFSVGMTLEDVSGQIRSVDPSGRQQVCEDIAETLGNSVNQSQRTISCLYLFKKLLSLVFVFSLILALSQYSIPKVEELQNDFDKFTTAHTDEQLQRVSDSNDSIAKTNGSDINEKIVQKPLPQSNDNQFLCDMEIRRMQNVQRYTIQCIPVEEKEMASNGNSSPNSNAQSPISPTVKNLLEFESLMCKIAFALLVILFISNLLSFCFWAYRLMSGSSRVYLGLQGNVPMDGVFLVQMARINASANVAHLLARSSFGVKM